MTYRPPFTVNRLFSAAVRTVPGLKYAGNGGSASEAQMLPCVVWSVIDSFPDFSHQNLIATTFQVSVHVAAKEFFDAEDLAGQVWAAILNAPSFDTSPVDGNQRIIAARATDSPVENRTPGQHLNFHEYRFTVYVTVGSSH